MKRPVQCAIACAVLILGIGVATKVWAQGCPGSDMTGSSKCIFFGGDGIVGGTATAGDPAAPTYRIAEQNMYPYQTYDLSEELEYWWDQAVADFTTGYNHRNNKLIIMGKTDIGGSDPLSILIRDKKANYETVGLVQTPDTTVPPDGLPDDCVIPQAGSDVDIGWVLQSARDTFAYDITVPYAKCLNETEHKYYPCGPGVDQSVVAKDHMNNAVKALGGIYLIVADEFLIDALEFRFSSDPGVTLTQEDRINQQIKLLAQAQVCYDKGVKSFLYGYGQALGTDKYMSDYFDDAVNGLFSVSLERLNTAIRERTARVLAQAYLPSAAISTAREAAFTGLRDLATTSYLIGVAQANKKGASFITTGGDKVVAALNNARVQANVFKDNLNPLGFDERYIPMVPPQNLLEIAGLYNTTAQTAAAALNASNRLFDSQYQEYKNSITKLLYNPGGDGIKNQLASMTGLDITMNDVDFVVKASEAGYDLFGCPTDLEDSRFSLCMSDPARTRGRLSIQYSQIRDRQYDVESALDEYSTITKTINDRLELSANQIKIINKKVSDIGVTLRDYQAAMEKAMNAEQDRKSGDLFGTIVRGITCVASVAVVAVSVGPTLGASLGVVASIAKAKGIIDAITTFKTPGSQLSSGAQGIFSSCGPPPDEFGYKRAELAAGTIKETKLQEILGQCEIAMNGAQTEYDVKQLLYQQAGQVILVQKARNNLRAAMQDYANELNDKNNLISQYVKALEYQKFEKELLIDQFAETRILKSEETFRLTESLRKAVHYAYLAAKAIEYRDLKPVANYRRIFRVMTPEDLTIFTNDLTARLESCRYGGVRTFPYGLQVSLAEDVLGLTDAAIKSVLGPGATTTQIANYRYEKVQSFISANLNSDILHYSFATSVYDGPPKTVDIITGKILSYEENMKIWNGPPDQPVECGTITDVPRGLSVLLETKQSLTPYRPWIMILQRGQSTYFDANQHIVEYVPVSKFFNVDFDLSETVNNLGGVSDDLKKYLDPNNLGDYSYDPTKTYASFSSFYLQNPLDPSSVVPKWTNAFQNRSIASSAWDLTIMDDISYPSTHIEWNKVKDIRVMVDTMRFDSN